MSIINNAKRVLQCRTVIMNSKNVYIIYINKQLLNNDPTTVKKHPYKTIIEERPRLPFPYMYILMFIFVVI